MFYYFTSVYEDASPVIRRYGMKKFAGPNRFEMFRSENAVLAVCGLGAINTSVAVTYLLQTFGAGAGDSVIGLGACEPSERYALNDILLCAKLTDSSTGRDHYPDILYKHPFTEVVLISREMGLEPASEILEDGVVKDNMGAFVYQAALFFVPSNNIHIIKLVSNGRPSDSQTEAVDCWLRERSEYERVFSHIYIEESAMKYPVAAEILAMYPEARRIKVNHYKDVFCKKGQDLAAQKNSQKLILAVNDGALLRKGSENCDAFGHDNFYYSTHIMNCLFGCEYCYLQGMYMSANIVVFVNLEDVLKEVEQRLRSQSLYICLSYDSDLLVFERFGFIRKWIRFARGRDSLELEIRTKSSAFGMINDIPPARNVVLAWTFSPQEYIDKFERGTPSLKLRMEAAKSAIGKGWRVRICVDPMLFTHDSESVYKHFFAELKEFIKEYNPEGLSVGVFRAPEKYIRKMRKLRPDSEIMCYKFINGTYSEEDRAALMEIADLCNIYRRN